MSNNCDQDNWYDFEECGMFVEEPEPTDPPPPSDPPPSDPPPSDPPPPSGGSESGTDPVMEALDALAGFAVTYGAAVAALLLIPLGYWLGTRYLTRYVGRHG